METEKSNLQDVPKTTVLYENHLRLTSKSRMAEFAGYLMPLWYSSISNEHRAVRHAAGLFDVSHMGVIRVSGPDAQNFLNEVTTNDTSLLRPGQAQYSYVLDPYGKVLDDLIIYRLAVDDFIVIANASNERKVRQWFDEILFDRAQIDLHEPQRKIPFKPQVIDLRTPGNCAKVDLAIQGPKSLEYLQSLMTDNKNKETIAAIKSFEHCRTNIGGFEVIAARTGYAGAKMGFELLIKPADAPGLWELLLEKCTPLGLEPCGLGARDSLRIEAGLPLYGHELDGPQDLSPYEAGYPWAVKLDKPFFIGKSQMLQLANHFEKQIFRLEFPGEKGIRPVRQNDPILNSDGKCIGHVTSAATIENKQIALALLERHSTSASQDVWIYYLARSQAHAAQGKKTSVAAGEQVNKELAGKIVSRFARF